MKLIKKILIWPKTECCPNRNPLYKILWRIPFYIILHLFLGLALGCVMLGWGWDKAIEWKDYVEKY